MRSRCNSGFNVHVMSSNENIFRITGPLWEESRGHRWIPLKRRMTWSFDVWFNLRLNKQFSNQSRCGWFETPSRSLWRQCKTLVRVCSASVFDSIFGIKWHPSSHALKYHNSSTFLTSLKMYILSLMGSKFCAQFQRALTFIFVCDLRYLWIMTLKALARWPPVCSTVV